MADWGLNVQEKSSVDNWTQRAKALNERATQIVKEGEQAVSEFKTAAEGQIFEKVAEYSDGVIKGMGDVLKGMNQMLDTVNKLVSKTTEKIKDLVGGVDALSKKTF